MEALREAFPEAWRKEPLGWEGVLAWEAQQHVTLPEPYRTLIAEVANGSSPGPPAGTGLLPLGWFPLSRREDDHERNPALPFPLDRGWHWEEDDRPREEVIGLVDAVHKHGSLLLGAESADEQWILITAGPQRGSVWLLTEIGAFPYCGPQVPPLQAEGPAVGLLDWVGRWCTGLGWFGID